MSKAAREAIMQKIAQKQKFSHTSRSKSAKRKGPFTIVKEFILAMEQVVTEAQSSVEFDEGLRREVGIFESRMKMIDPEVNLRINWNSEGSVENWQQLQVEGVTIYWSRFYLRKHPFESAEKTIDVGTLFLEGHLE